MIDLEYQDSPDVDQDMNEDEALQMARAMGTENLYSAYQGLFPDSKVPVDKLGELFEAAGLTASTEQVEAAIAMLCPEVGATGSVPYAQCEELFLHLQQQWQRAMCQDLELVKAGCVTRWIAGLSDEGSTNLLLVVVVTLCSISAFLAGGLAILLLAVDERMNIANFLQENLGIVQDTVEVYAKQIAVQQANNRSAMFITTMSSVLQYVAFAATVDANSNQISRMMTTISYALSAWMNSAPQQGFINLAALAAQLTNRSLSKYGRSSTVAIVNEMNGKMPSGSELLLGQWKANSTTAVEFLTQLRNANQCVNATPDVDGAGAAAMKAALSGKAAAGWMPDYCGTPVCAGYGSTSGLGLQYNLPASVPQAQRLLLQVAMLSGWSLDSSNSWDYLLGFSTGTTKILATTLLNCDATCAERAVAEGMPLARALNGESGSMTYIDFRGSKSVAVFAPVPNTMFALAIQMAYTDIATITLKKATALVDNLNRNFPSGSEEFELTAFSNQGNATTFTHLSTYKYGAQCPSGQCTLATEYVMQAATTCSTGVMRATDYRGVGVLVGYACISDLSAVLSFKLDVTDLDAEILSVIVRAVDYHSEEDTETSEEFVVAKPKAGLTAAQVKDYGDFNVVSKLKYPNACAKVNCSWNRECALYALQDRRDVVDANDYRNVPVLAAPSRSYAISYGIGLSLKQDQAEAFEGMMSVILMVGCFTGGMVVVCTITLIVMTKLFMRSMIKDKEDGRRVVEREKERFSKLVTSMYPKFVLPQLLEGDKQMVCEVPGAAVFFSDIHEFTSASNTMGSEELLRLMGYVYGVMDYIGDSFGVYKVKTIGDAYLAVRGLPGSDSENPSLELLRYASFVCQVFGDRFVHPTEGEVLALMNGAMRWNGSGLVKQRSKPRLKEADGGESQAPSTAPSKTSKVTSKKSGGKPVSVAEAHRQQDQVQCIMSYGLAVGKIVAGVLAGRCPMFDIWGGTVNLASRMQSTGEPGRIQVSEQLYKKVMAVPGQPFSFEAPRTTFCKGFGNVQCYMVRTTTEGLPKDLQIQLRLEPRYGSFHFDNILTSMFQNGVERQTSSYAAAYNASGAHTHDSEDE